MPKQPLQLKETQADQLATHDTRPKNPPASSLPIEGYSLEVDGKSKSHYSTAGEASAAGAELKRKYPNIQVNIYDAKTRTRTLVESSL